LSIGLQIVASCGPTTPASVTLSNEYLKPVVSQLNHKMLIAPGVTQREESCQPQQGTIQRESAAGELVAVFIAKQVINFATKKAKRALKKYTRHTHFEMEAIPSTKNQWAAVTPSDDPIRVSQQCFHIKWAGDMPNDGATEQAPSSDTLPPEVLTLLTRYYYRTGSDVPYGMKVRPIWFSPELFVPEKFDANSDTEMAIAVAFTPVYFSQNSRKTASTLKLFSVKLPNEYASGKGFFINFAQDAEDDWASRPMLAAAPTGQLSTFKIEVLAGVDIPILLKLLNDEIPGLEEDLAEELKKKL
jgi:hypothetical protein